MGWPIELTPEVQRWHASLGERDAARVQLMMDRLRERGPVLGRPHADVIHGARHHHMKELRSRGTGLRILFAFDPRRRAILLVGGDKANDWRGWYVRAIPQADRLYDDHLRAIGKEAACHRGPRGAGSRSAQHGR